MNRQTTLLRAGFGIAGIAAAGMVGFGDGVTDVLRVLTWQFGQSTGGAMNRLLYAGLLALLFAVGATLATRGLAGGRGLETTTAGRLTWAFAGVLTILGAGAVMAAALLEIRTLQEMATAAGSPSPEKVTEAARQARSIVSSGWLLLFAACFAGQVAAVQTKCAAPGSGVTSRAERNTAMAVGAFAWVCGLLLFSSWLLHGRALEAIFSNTQAVKPDELARHMSGIMYNTLGAGFFLALHGLAVACLSWAIPRPVHSVSASNSSTNGTM